MRKYRPESTFELVLGLFCAALGTELVIASIFNELSRLFWMGYKLTRTSRVSLFIAMSRNISSTECPEAQNWRTLYCPATSSFPIKSLDFFEDVLLTDECTNFSGTCRITCTEKTSPSSCISECVRSRKNTLRYLS